MPELDKLSAAIIAGDDKNAIEITQKALAENSDAQELVSKYMIPAMDEVGRRFDGGEYFVPELLISARAMKGALNLVRPILASSGSEPTGRVVIGTVTGDLHDIGKNLVSYMLEGGGFEVTDLGVNVSAADFASAVREKNANIIALSALLTTTMTSMKTIIEELESAGLRDQVKVIIGGAPVTQQFADDVGADGYKDTAVAAVSLARELVAK